MNRIQFSLSVLMALCLSCEKEDNNGRNTDIAYCTFEIGDYLYDFREDAESEKWQSTNRQGSEDIMSSTYISSFGLTFNDFNNGLIKRAEIYFSYIHHGNMMTSDYIFYGRHYFIADSNFHNMFFEGEHEYKYRTPTPSNNYKVGENSVYIQLMINDSIIYPLSELFDSNSFKFWYSYKIIDGMYLSNPNNYFYVTESEVLNPSYDLKIYGKSRSRKIKGTFDCMLYNKNKETGFYDSIWIKDAQWFGIIEE